MKFPRKVRLTRQSEFRAVFAGPGVSSDRCFRVLSRPNGLAYSRLGMAVSRRNCRLASDRNRIKRVIRESFRANQAGLSRQGGLDLVVLPGTMCATMCNRDLAESLEAHWKRLFGRGSSQAKKKTRKVH